MRWFGALHSQRVEHCIVSAILIALTIGIIVSSCVSYPNLNTREAESLKVSFEQSGGVAGLRFTDSIDTDKLPPEQAQKLRQMIGDANFFNLPARIFSPRPQPDRFQYKLRVQEGSRQHTVTVSEEAMPANLAPLVKWLAEAARRKLRERLP